MKPLRSRRGDAIAAVALTLVAIIVVALIWVTAPIRQTSHHPTPDAATATQSVGSGAGSAPEVLQEPPRELHEAWRFPTTPLPGVSQAVTAQGVSFAVDNSSGGTIRAINEQGDIQWSYSRQYPICGLAELHTTVVVTFRSPVGCGDVVSFDAATGAYHATRSAISPDDVVTVRSPDRVGVASPQRVELWRDNLVRTVEYGRIAAPQEADAQPYPNCRRTSALTRLELLAITEDCGDDGSWLRFIPTSPDDSRKPDITADIPIAGDARLISVGGDSAAIMTREGETSGATIISFSTDGHERARTHIATTGFDPEDDQASPASVVGLYAPRIADLPNHTSFFDCQALHLLQPDTLEVNYSLDDAIGTGIAIGDSLLYPTAEGMSVVDRLSGHHLRTIAVDRSDMPVGTPVSLAMAGTTIIELRGGAGGGELVALTPGAP